MVDLFMNVVAFLGIWFCLGIIGLCIFAIGVVIFKDNIKEQYPEEYENLGNHDMKTMVVAFMFMGAFGFIISIVLFTNPKLRDKS